MKNNLIMIITINFKGLKTWILLTYIIIKKIYITVSNIDFLFIICINKLL